MITWVVHSVRGLPLKLSIGISHGEVAASFVHELSPHQAHSMGKQLLAAAEVADYPPWRGSKRSKVKRARKARRAA